jgi:hypothetical protein
VTKGEGAIRREVGSRCLVGKLWADRLANKEAFKTILSRIWRIVGTVVSKNCKTICGYSSLLRRMTKTG